jgi:hypothetical protein
MLKYFSSFCNIAVSIKIHISCVVINYINSDNKSFNLVPQTFKQIHFISEKSSKTAVLALKSPTSAHFMSFSMKFTNSFSISKNASIDEYREFSGRMYTVCFGYI